MRLSATQLGNPQEYHKVKKTKNKNKMTNAFRNIERKL